MDFQKKPDKSEHVIRFPAYKAQLVFKENICPVCELGIAPTYDETPEQFLLRLKKLKGY